ncbi:diaminopimelate epimerase [Terrihabitans sp. B22-R8]|uniref:diaminopimelate epimerase n=1 Tax=Terrihabitans sp. B22-R8 TaxID=3425128 RepID=UPI00403C0611
MSALANHPFVKMNGLGNEILVVDLRDGTPAPSPEETRAIHASGLTFDQIMTIEPGSGDEDFRTRILNQDGSESGACGNGTRCIAWLVMEETGKDRLRIGSAGGALIAVRGDGPRRITVDMGAPRFGWAQIPLAEPCEDTRAIAVEAGPLRTPSAANVGNPHAIFWVSDIEAYDLAVLGPELERHPMFPGRANISLAHVTSRDALTLKVWERGAGLTLACGTAACAAAVSAARTGRTGRQVCVTLPGGELLIHWRESDDHILMTGPVETEFEGRFDPSIFAGHAA